MKGKGRKNRPALNKADALKRAERKLREAHFFLGDMKVMEQQQTQIAGPGELAVFAFYLSAFQSAARSVVLVLRAGHLGRQFDSWLAGLAPVDAALVTFMEEERDNEVHLSGTTEKGQLAMVKISELRPPGYARGGLAHYHQPTHQFFGPPGTPEPEIGVTRFTYFFDASDKRVTDVCERYLVLLGDLVAKV